MKLTPAYPKICLKIIRIWQEFERHSAILSTLVIATYSSQAWHFIVKNLLRKNPKKKIDKLELINIWQWCTKNKLVRTRKAFTQQSTNWRFFEILEEEFCEDGGHGFKLRRSDGSVSQLAWGKLFSFTLWVNFTNTFMNSF